jgi:ABC-type dipeptide/oligopeptide/nickel transport system permease subunit
VPFGRELVIRGAKERLVPIMMTVLTTGLALIPLLLTGSIPGQEIEHPMAVVILGGLVTATLLNLFVVPSLYLRFANTMLTMPPLVMLITVQAALKTGIYGQMIVLGILFAPRVLRVVRSATVTVVEAPFVAAGRLSGCSHARILGRYVLPNVREQVIVQVSYLLSIALVVETGISFLGIGVQPPGASLGTLLTGGIAMLTSRAAVILIPAAVTVLLILAFNILGDRIIDGGRDGRR